MGTSFEQFTKRSLQQKTEVLKHYVQKSLKVKDSEIKKLKDKLLKFEIEKKFEKAKLRSEIEELESTILKQDTVIVKLSADKPCDICKEKDSKINELTTHNEIEETRLKEHIFKRKLRIENMKTENKGLKTVVMKQEAKIKTLLREYAYLNDQMISQPSSDSRDTSTSNLVTGPDDPNDFEKDDSKTTAKKESTQISNPQFSLAPHLSNLVTNLEPIKNVNISDQSFLDKIRSKTNNTISDTREVPITDQKVAQKRKLTDQNNRTRRKRNI